MSRYKDIELSVTDRVARITLNRPPVNVFNIAMMQEVADAVNRVGLMADVCALVFAAAPASRAFSAGVSIEEHRVETSYQMLENFHAIFRALHQAAKPVVALVAGAALGGGCELAAYADIVIATPAARFGQPEIKIGAFPPLAVVILPRVIGEKKAREMVLTGELLSAEAARFHGLVNYVVGEGELEAKAEEVLGGLRQLSAPVLETARRALDAVVGLPFEQALKRSEDLYLNQLMALKDATEGVEAFIAKRPPQWKHK